METDIKLLIVDDSVLYRKILNDIFALLPGVKVVGKAKDGKDAIDQIKRLKPDMITLDVEMPIMDGIATLERIKKNALSVAVIMVSALTKAGANTTMKALELGALDFITKPDSTDMDRNRKHIESQLRPILNIFKIKQRAQRVVASAKRQET
ncbi:MAG: response regulator, partial [Candidatus Marinimicrobia bacterium]|nr:response regulator [Candidatus Neomarinimicrobiota bacterium]